MRSRLLCASILHLLRLANLLDELLHEDERIGQIQAELSATIEFEINEDLAVLVLVVHTNVVNVGKRDRVLTKMEYCHTGLSFA